jgi:hypothetical protein
MMQRLSSLTDLQSHDIENPGRQAGVFCCGVSSALPRDRTHMFEDSFPGAAMTCATSFLALCAGLLLSSSARADGPGDCERQGLAFSKRQGGTISRIQIDKGDSLVVNRLDDKVGNQMVSIEYMGFARVTTLEGIKRQRFVCLHEGDGKRALYFGLLME